MDMIPENAMNAGEELRKRRSSRIVQAVPLMVKGVDALGRPFVERTSSLISNCHGCRYQSKHYVLKNMWVTLEIPHPETGQLPRQVRGRVAWIQRPRTVRQLFQVALELEIPGNVWGIGFPPEDWGNFVVPASTRSYVVKDEDVFAALPDRILDAPTSVGEPELPPPAIGTDTLHVLPSPASTTDASLQLARQVARLVADARQQIQAAAREAASQAVSVERRLSFEQWEQKFAAGRAEIADETARAIEKLRQETDKHSREAHAAAAEALRTELPRWLAPQLEQLTRDLTARLSQEALAQRSEQVQRLEATAESLRTACQQAEETAARLKTEVDQAEAHIAAHAETATLALEETASQREDAANVQRAALDSRATELQQQVTVALTAAQASWHEQVSKEFEAAQGHLRESLEGTVAEAQDRAAGGLNEHIRALIVQFQEETARHATALRESAGAAVAGSEQRLAVLCQGVHEQSQKLESIVAPPRGRGGAVRKSTP